MYKSGWLKVGLCLLFSKTVLADPIELSYEGYLGPLFAISGTVKLDLSEDT